MTSEATDSHADVQRLCSLAGLPRATYYRHLNRRSRETADCELRDQLQRICLKHPFYGYRRVTATIQRKGMIVNAKKVLRLMREDNLLAQRKAPFLKPPAERPRDIVVVPNLVRAWYRPLLIRSGSRTSPTSISPRPSPISRSSSTPSRARRLAGPSRTRSMPHSRSRHWTGQSRPASRGAAA
jgi:hypothetical protein